MSIQSRVQCLVCGNVLMHCTCATGPCLHSGAGALIATLRARLAEVERVLAAAQEVAVRGNSTSIPEGDQLDCALLHDIADLHSAKKIAEARCEKLREALMTARVEFSHTPPNDCYSTGPFTGDIIQDHVACPGCAVIAKIDAALAECEEVPNA